jgi:hypothetical protein
MAVPKLENGPIKEWYIKNSQVERLYKFAKIVEPYGYTLDPKSGLLFAHPFSDDIIRTLGYTVLQIIFPRPTDLHYHPDVAEAISTLSGKGKLFKQTHPIHTLFPKEFKYETLTQGKSSIIPVNTPHAFVPSDGEYLEILLNCTANLDTQKEVTVRTFDKLPF